MESGGVVLLLPWLIAYTRREGLRKRDVSQEALEEAKLTRASSACLHAGGAKMAARNLLAEPRSAGNEETWNTLVVKFPPENHAAVSAAATAALASVTEVEDGNAPPWRPDGEYASEVLFDVINSRSTVSGSGNDGQRRSAGNEETWNTLVVKFPPENHAAVSAAATAALASVTEVEDGNAPPWRPDGEYASEVLFDVINSRSTVSGSGNDGQRLAHLPSIIHTDMGREEFGRGIATFSRRIVDEPDAFPPEFWQLFLLSSLTRLGGKCRPVCVGMTWRRLITAGAMRQWRPPLEEVQREVRQFGVAVPGRAEHA